MKLRTALVLFLLSFALVGCSGLNEPLTRAIQTLIADDELGILKGDAEPSRLPLTGNVVEEAKATSEAEAPTEELSEEEAEIVHNLLKFNALNACVGCDLLGVDLKKANLTGANLKNADLTRAKLKDAKIESTILCNTKTPWGLDNSGCK